MDKTNFKRYEALRLRIAFYYNQTKVYAQELLDYVTTLAKLGFQAFYGISKEK